MGDTSLGSAFALTALVRQTLKRPLSCGCDDLRNRAKLLLMSHALVNVGVRKTRNAGGAG